MVEIVEADASESEVSEPVDTPRDLKWMCLVCLVTIFVWWLGYLSMGPYYLQRYRIMMAGFSMIFLFFDLATLTAATLHLSGVRSQIIHHATVVLFVLSMISLFLVYATGLLLQTGII